MSADNPFELPAELAEPKPASDHTRTVQQAFRQRLPLDDGQSFEAAARGFIATLEPLTIPHDRGRRPAYDLSALAFVDGEAPATVNPSLWRQARLNARHHGLFEVVDGIYQIRSFDIANMTLVRGDSGWIVIDPLTSAEAARAGLALANRHLGDRPVRAVIHTHSHADHFAGVFGVVSEDEVSSGRVPVLAPEHFVDEALAENVLAGNAMARRATWMYGNLLPPSPTGFVTTGLGAALSMGTTGFVVPTDLICRTGETRCLDGIDIDFQMTPGTEAPAEMVFYFPQFRALCMSEITSHHLHNLYTPRGAQVRDALAWSRQIQESIDRYGDRLAVQFASHHWPTWGAEAAVRYLEQQRDLYRYIHDQTLRLANHGFNKEEAAEGLRLPASLDREFHCRDYYGALYANARAVYDRYLGFFDGNPANLHPLPPVAAARRYLDYMGGADAVVERARASFAEGDYRWVAEVLNHVVQAQPAHVAGRALLADCFEQLGYQAEAAPWRNFYLSGAQELRREARSGTAFNPSEDTARSMPLANLFDALAVRLNGPRADGLRLDLVIEFEDAPVHLLTLCNAVLHAFADRRVPAPDAVIRCSSLNFKRLMLGLTDAAELIAAGRLAIDGDAHALARLAELFDRFERRFPLITPRPQAPEEQSS